MGLTRVYTQNARRRDSKHNEGTQMKSDMTLQRVRLSSAFDAPLLIQLCGDSEPKRNFVRHSHTTARVARDQTSFMSFTFSEYLA